MPWGFAWTHTRDEMRWKDSLGLLQDFANLIFSSLIISSPSLNFFACLFHSSDLRYFNGSLLHSPKLSIFLLNVREARRSSLLVVDDDLRVLAVPHCAWLKSDSKRITRALISMIAFPALWPGVFGLRGLFGEENGHVWCNNDKRVHSWQLCCGNLTAYREQNRFSSSQSNRKIWVI